MMPRIEAAETLGAVNRAVLGNNRGFANELDHQRAMDAIRAAASGEGAPAPAKADPADLAAMGIGIANAGDQPVIADLDAWLGNGEASNG